MSRGRETTSRRRVPRRLLSATLEIAGITSAVHSSEIEQAQLAQTKSKDPARAELRLDDDQPPHSGQAAGASDGHEHRREPRVADALFAGTHRPWPLWWIRPGRISSRAYLQAQNRTTPEGARHPRPAAAAEREEPSAPHAPSEHEAHDRATSESSQRCSAGLEHVEVR